MLPTTWEKIVAKLDFAFQPIVYSTTGKLFAVEALLRNVKKAGKFETIFEFFDAAYKEGILYQLDLELRRIALTKFSHINIDDIVLFYNLDNRLMRMSDYSVGNTTNILQDLNIEKKYLCFEISERGSMENPHEISSIVNLYKSEGFNIALDDYGTGISGLKLLYFSEPNFIKLDRFFIQDIEQDYKKKHFCSSIIDMAHSMGMQVIAEGVETKKEFFTCKDIGCDMIQGYFIQRPTVHVKEIELMSSVVIALNKNEKRSNVSNNELLNAIEKPKALSNKATMKEIFNYFKKNKERVFAPLVNEQGQLEGVIYEETVKHISYSQYGMALAQNTMINDKIKEYVNPALSVELSWGMDKIIETYSNSSSQKKGIFITQNNNYFGFISLNNLLKIIYNKNLFIAKNQNPLTKLPGNLYIEEFIADSFNEIENKNSHLLYFDFNDFKPFNDFYGFRKGDRVIILFAEILQKILGTNNFIGHIGGDDYFVGIRDKDSTDVYETAKLIQREFKHQVLSFYSNKDLKNAYIEIADRHGIKRRFDTMSVACAILEINKKSKIEYLDDTLAMVKKMSKKSKNPVSISLESGRINDETLS